MPNDNPLLDLTGLPRFGAIVPEHVEPALDWVLARNREAIQHIIDTVKVPEWDNFMAPLEQLDDELNRIWGPVSHLHSVMDPDGLRPVYQKCLPKLSDYRAEQGHNRALHRAIHRIRHQGHYTEFDPARRKVIDQALLAFHLAGIDLDLPGQARYAEICKELSHQCHQFSRNVQDATDHWHIDVVEESGLAGISDGAREVARQVAEEAGVRGWRFTLQTPSYLAVMTHAENAQLREEVYRAFVTRASETGPGNGQWDNGPIMQEILRLRKELAQLLGYDHYAEYALADRMAADTEEVVAFLRQLADRCRLAAMEQNEALEEFAREEMGLDRLEPWDRLWASEKLRQHEHDLREEALRPYFPLPQVLQGLFWIAAQLFGIEVVPVQTPSVWHPDVRFFCIRDAKGEPRGYFYTDLYARPRKRAGAWMMGCIDRRRTGSGRQLPVACLVCNFSPPSGNRPCLLTHEEVVTLFHEFGHGLHHLLTTVDVAAVAGINGVPWDAVELPSQLLENWCWEPEALSHLSAHIETGEPLPAAMLEKMRRARTFQSAMKMCRQLVFALFDMRVHGEWDPWGDRPLQELVDEVRKEVGVVWESPLHRFPHTFDHIFAGGYAAGYYSYLWSEVLSADAFSLFAEKGIFDRSTGLRFLHSILEPGGSEDPMVLFQEFRGRKPTVDPLLQTLAL